MSYSEREIKEKRQFKVASMADILRLESKQLTEGLVFPVPYEILNYAQELSNPYTISSYIKRCCLIYELSAIYHGVVPFQKRDNAYSWLTPFDFSWNNFHKIKFLSNLADEWLADKTYIQTETNTVPVYDLKSGKLLYYQQRLYFDKFLKFYIPDELFVIDSIQYSNIYNKFVYDPISSFEEKAINDDLRLDHMVAMVYDIVDNLRRPLFLRKKGRR